MPMTTRFDLEAGVRFHTVTGEVTLELIREWLMGTYAHPDFVAGQHAVWDLTEAQGSVSRKDIRCLAAAVKEAFPGAEQVKVALIVSRDVHYGISRMYEQILDDDAPIRIGVFRDQDAALNWLDDGAV